MVKFRTLQIIWVGALLSSCSTAGSRPNDAATHGHAPSPQAQAESNSNQAQTLPSGTTQVDPTQGDHSISSDLAQHPTEMRKLWTQKAAGIITDLNVSRNGRALLVATAPDFETVGSTPKYQLSRYDHRGKLTWRAVLKGGVKAQALTDDGKLALVATYENEVFAMNEKGKKTWSIEATCKPIPLHGRFLCYHDDDAEPAVAFDIYSDQGKKLFSYAITRDVLAVDVSEDARNIAVALTDGQIVLFGPDYKTLWQKKVEGEIVDLAVTSGENPKVVALFNQLEHSHVPSDHLVVFDLKGARIAEGVPAQHVEQVEWVPDGSGLAVYGNGAQGQYLGFFELPKAPGNTLQQKWRKGDSRIADYASSVIATRGLVILGYENVTATDRHSHLLGYDLAGHLKWNIPLVTDEGAYLYAQGYAPDTSFLGVGTDDGRISAFELKSR